MAHTVNDYDNGEKGDTITLDVCVDCTEHYNNNEEDAQGSKFAYLINTSPVEIIRAITSSVKRKGNTE